MKKKKPAPKRPKAKKAPKVRSNVIAIPKVGNLKQNGFTRPTSTWSTTGKPKLTHRVWQIADEISARHKLKVKKGEKAGPATRAEVLAACEKEKIPYATFSNNFYRWRKFNGIFLRRRKDGKLSKPMGPRGPRKLQVKKVKGPRKPAGRPKGSTKAKPPAPKRPASPQKKPAPAKKATPAKAKKPAKPTPAVKPPAPVSVAPTPVVAPAATKPAKPAFVKPVAPEPAAPLVVPPASEPAPAPAPKPLPFPVKPVAKGVPAFVEQAAGK